MLDVERSVAFLAVFAMSRRRRGTWVVSFLSSCLLPLMRKVAVCTHGVALALMSGHL